MAGEPPRSGPHPLSTLAHPIPGPASRLASRRLRAAGRQPCPGHHHSPRRRARHPPEHPNVTRLTVTAGLEVRRQSSQDVAGRVFDRVGAQVSSRRRGRWLCLVACLDDHASGARFASANHRSCCSVHLALGEDPLVHCLLPKEDPESSAGVSSNPPFRRRGLAAASLASGVSARRAKDYTASAGTAHVSRNEPERSGTDEREPCFTNGATRA